MTADAMTAGATRRLVVLRHAKSARPDGVADPDRPLAPRGRRDAPVAGAWLRDADCVPGLVLCSPSRRTRETWDLASAELSADPPIRFDDRIYHGSAEQLIAAVGETPPDVRTLLLVGHSPGVQDLILLLAGDGDPDALARTEEKFPTSAIAVLRVPGGWPELAPGRAQLTEMVVPRGEKD
ncbi:histidine phosphatase family protein [Streptomyces sp. NPDC047108]|uniref:SixA phosphatase family protein n=1 Tax=Streptomyces sp. NPDC047108 TaxID=3155025 RepID=UPI0033FEBDFC